MITTYIPPVHRPSFLKKVAKQGTDQGHQTSVANKPAHPLFPPDQAFLWLPGLPGDQVAFCTRNESPDHHRMSSQAKRDKNHALLAPPYRVSPESFIAWHTNVTPPFPFHPVPIARTLRSAELAELGRRVHNLANQPADPRVNPLRILRNDRKCFILAVLAGMGLLAGRVPQPR